MPEVPTTVLLVEDERIVRITVRDALAKAGYRVTELSDGAAALRIRQIHPDAAVLLFTAHAELDDAVAVMREGARDYVEKPFEMDELLLRLARVRDELYLDTARSKRVTMKQMEKGQSCGACHDGKRAPGLDDCSSCHS